MNVFVKNKEHLRRTKRNLSKMWNMSIPFSLYLIVILILFHENCASSVPKKGFLPSINSNRISRTTKPFSLQVRGGQLISQMKDTKEYATIGLVNLMSQGEVSSTDPSLSSDQILMEKEGSLLESILGDWIKLEVVENNMETGAIITIPHSTIVENSGDFSRGRIKSQDYGAVLETMGCLVDSIFLLYNSSLSDRHTYIARLLKGFERQKQRVLSSGRSKVVNIFLIADGDDAVKEVKALKKAILDYENGEGSELWGVHIHIIPFTKEEVIEGFEEDICNHQSLMKKIWGSKISQLDFDESQDGDISIEIFQHLVQQIHSSLRREKSAFKFAFDSVTVGIKDKVFEEAEVFINDDNGNEVDDVVSVTINTPGGKELMKDKIETSSDFNEAAISDAEGRQQQQTSDSIPEIEQLRTEDSAPENVRTMSDKKEVKNPNTSTEKYQGFLKVSSEKLLLKARERIQKLEAKQDEILLDPDSKMPILEFGSDAGSILKEALEYFGGLPYIRNEDFPSELMEGKTIFLWCICYQVTVTS